MTKNNIKEIKPRQIYDSRGNPTIEVDIVLSDGTVGRGIVPSGASTGDMEALELRDGDINRLGGKGVSKAISNISDILAPEIIGMNVFDQVAIDSKMIELDGTENKSRLGANAILGISMATAWAAANASKQPLFRYLGGSNARTIPTPMVQIIGGGAHANHEIDLQDFLIIPTTESSFSDGYEMIVNVYNAAKQVFLKYSKPLGIADEGGLWPTGFKKNEEALELLQESIETAGYTPGKDMYIAVDIAASEFYDRLADTYELRLENKIFSSVEFVDYICSLRRKYPIISIEDGLSEFDWPCAKMLTDRLGKDTQLIGDDLFATNISQISAGAKQGVYNSVLIKMNQIGTLTETLETIEYTKKVGYRPVISARSGETEDITIAHLAVATNAGQIKVGSVVRSERTAKWNEIIRIEEYLGRNALYNGVKALDK
jgi:enolase